MEVTGKQRVCAICLRVYQSETLRCPQCHADSRLSLIFNSKEQYSKALFFRASSFIKKVDPLIFKDWKRKRLAQYKIGVSNKDE